MPLNQFATQVARLVELGYPELLRLPEDEFRQSLAPLQLALPTTSAPLSDGQSGEIPFVIVINSPLAPARTILRLVRRSAREAIERLYPIQLDRFEPIPDLGLPSGHAYLLIDVDRGDGYRNVTPNDAFQTIRRAGCSPLTIEEGIAVLTHFPGFLEKNRCFSLLASRCGDKRVPAFWLSGEQPKLGWCWAGNVHTWIGSASCRLRVGA